MNWITDEMLFYGGIAAAGGSLLASIVCFAAFKIQKIRLDSQLDEEYGKENRKRK